MIGRRFVTRMRTIADFIGGVAECSAAAQARRRPSRAALHAVGIDADAYYRIHR